MNRNIVWLSVAIVGILGASTARCWADDFTFKAYDGEPFGVASILLHPDPSSGKPPEFVIEQLGDGALYPVKSESNCYFLYDPKTTKEIVFRGKPITIKPTATVDNGPWKVELGLWWKSYTSQANSAQTADNMPLQVDQYLVNMLARRLKFDDVELNSRTYMAESDETRFFALLSGAESVRIAMQRETLLQNAGAHQPPTEPLPAPTLPPAITIPEPAADVVVEPLAMTVPPEFFYVRMASYSDLTWARNQVDQLGTNIRDLVNTRGFDFHLSERIQDQLELHDSVIAQLLGPQVIDDIAIIGTDTFLREGAGIGILFHAKVNEALELNLNAQRAARAKKEPGATLEDVSFDNDPGKHSFLSTPDNRLRSYYVRSGDFHLVTTSEFIARRFLEVSHDPTTSLGALKEFRYARTVMPLSRQDNVFVHLSDPFFRSFIDPKTRIEMTRRARSDNEMELVRLAALAAKAEKHPADSIKSLIDGGFLPSGFGQRVDGSQLEWDGTTVTDSLRGARGSFLPVCDITINKVTAAEVAAYESFAQMYLRLWRRMDPATAAVRRVDEGDRERTIVDLHVCPFPVQEYGFLSFLHKDTDQKQLAPIDGVLMYAEANLFGPNHTVAGLTDFEVDAKVLESANLPADISTVATVFVGDRRRDKLPFGIFGDKFPVDVPDDEVKLLSRTGYSNYGIRAGGYTFWSDRKEPLQVLAGKIKDIDAPRKAKVRLHIADISKANITKGAHVLAWFQAAKIAKGNVELLNRLVNQFRVKPTDAVSNATLLFNASPISPLSGEWRLEDGQPISETGGIEKMDYRQPLLHRLRAAEVELDSESNVLTTHVEWVLDK